MSMKHSNQGLSSKEELIKFIDSIGFLYNSITYEFDYKEFRIDIWGEHYNFYNSSEWLYGFDLDDLKPIDNYFKKELRTIKLKRILE